MGRYRGGLIAALALFLGALVAGVFVAQRFGPSRLRDDVEERLSALLGTPVSVAHLNVSPGTFIRIEGGGVRAWPGPAGFGLEIQQVSGSIDALSLLTGDLRLRRMLVVGPQLRVRPGARGRWSPAVTAGEESSEALGDPATPNPGELLGPLISLETVVRSLLEAPRLATSLEIRDGRITFEDGEGQSATPLALDEIHGRLLHRRFRRRSELSLRARLVEDGLPRGSIELNGHRDRDGAIQIALAVNSAELGVSARYVRGLRPQAQLEGTLSGAIVFETPEPGTGRLAIDLVCRDLASAVPAADADTLELIRSPMLAIEGVLEITPHRATLRDARIRSRDTTLVMNGTVARPVQATSRATLDVEFENVEVSQVRHLIGWLPEIEREEAAVIVSPLKSGRLVGLRASGGATLSDWQAFVAGRTRELPEAFRFEAELADTVVHVGETDRLEGLSGRLHWTGQRAVVRDATAVLNGTPLPVLNLVVDGFPNFFAGDPALRELHSGAEPLAGLGTLWASMRPDPDRASVDVGTTIDLEIDTLEHPMFVWPIRELTAIIETRADGIHVEPARGIWAGVPIRGTADWSFSPSEQVSVRLTAGLPGGGPSIRIREDGWARGRFRVGPISGGRWRQSAADGHFVASGGQIELNDVVIELLPAGEIDLHGRLELAGPEAVPFRLNFDLNGGDAPALAGILGLPSQVEGRVDMAGSFEGVLRRNASLYQELSGLLAVTATEGLIRKVAPPVIAIAEASEAIDAFDPREIVRYQRIETLLEFGDGHMHTETFSLDGPDMGVVASGDLDLVGENREIDARVALFLFRKLDRVLGKIPILNRLLLGTDANLVAAAFEVKGSWQEPEVKSILLPRSAGPASLVLQGVPMFVMRGIRSLGSLLRPDPALPAGPASIDLPGGPSGS